MSLRPCYRATCDAPGCPAAEMLPHDRAGSARAQLEAMGWTVVQHRVRPEAPGAPRISYMCPEHRNRRPPGWRSARIAEIRRQAGRIPRERRISLDGVDPPTVHLVAVCRGAMYWMLVQALAAQSRPQGDLAIAAGVSKQRVSQVVADYDATLQRRQQSAEGWQEPWARRLRAAGAIR